MERLDTSYRVDTMSPVLGTESSIAVSSGDVREGTSDSESTNARIRKRGRQSGSKESKSPADETPGETYRWERLEEEKGRQMEDSGTTQSGKKRRKLSGFYDKRIFTSAQKKVLEEKLAHLDVMSSVQMADEAIGFLTRAEIARRKSQNIKEELNNHIKEGIYIARNAIQS